MADSRSNQSKIPPRASAKRPAIEKRGEHGGAGGGGERVVRTERDGKGGGTTKRGEKRWERNATARGCGRQR